ncbi:hypothetical protein AU252_10030 [Pseudarthrobacter sulfonivorans]|uniref:GntR C-terminal domain-containing protein n=1 Tax=Pseudarthrobacter sulfonivorans TaxID=121292 RepID=A0A0U3QMC2_9MICC|nr:hypothetical protein AU252_10030 [Pseudarthrobacter sulfonivorans]
MVAGFSATPVTAILSRSPVREALRILTSEGIVNMPAGGSGATVRTRSLEDLVELYDLRISLEPEIAKFVTQGAMRRDIDALRTLAEKMAASSSVPEWMRLNFDFHTTLYKLANRPHTEHFLKNLLSLVQPYTQTNIEWLGGRNRADDEHAEMIKAITDDDPEKLAKLFVTHLVAARDQLVENFEAEDKDDPLLHLRGFTSTTPS